MLDPMFIMVRALPIARWKPPGDYSWFCACQAIGRRELLLPPNRVSAVATGAGQGRLVPASAASEPLTGAGAEAIRVRSGFRPPAKIPNCLRRKPSQTLIFSPVLLSRLVRYRAEGSD